MTLLSAAEAAALVGWVRATSDEIIGCDDAAPFLAVLAEQVRRHGPLPTELERARTHLAECPDCTEELALIVAALEATSP